MYYGLPLDYFNTYVDKREEGHRGAGEGVGGEAPEADQAVYLVVGNGDEKMIVDNPNAPKGALPKDRKMPYEKDGKQLTLREALADLAKKRRCRRGWSRRARRRRQGHRYYPEAPGNPGQPRRFPLRMGSMRKPRSGRRLPRRQRERGNSLVLAMIVLTALGTLSMLTLMSVRSGMQTSSGDRFRSTALYAAESGAAAAMDYLRGTDQSEHRMDRRI